QCSTLRHRPLTFDPSQGPLNGDRIGVYRGQLASIRHRRAVPIDACLKNPIDTVDEIVAVDSGMEPKNTASQEPLQNFLAPGADPETFRVRPGDVPESNDRRVRQFVSDQFRK